MRYGYIVQSVLILVAAAGCGGNHSMPATPTTYAALPQTVTHSGLPQTQAPIITLDATSSGPTVAPDAFGASIATWYDFLRPFVNPSLEKTGIQLVRFPGGSESDAYHWEHGDSTAKLGIVVDTPNDKAWNDVVLKKAQPFDFVEVHYYPEYQVDDDKKLLGPDIARFAGYLKGLRAQMTAAGLGKDVPIYLGEFNNDAGAEGKQSVSIVNGLYLGQMAGTLIDAGVPMSTWWLAYGSCNQNGDFSKKLYGWQTFGTEALFSDDIPEYGCPNAPHIPGGTPFPTARVMALFSSEVPAGSNVRTTTVPPSLHSNVRAYGFAESNGYAFVIFNNTLSPINVKAQVTNAGKNGFTGRLATYGKAQYDQSKQNRWVGPVYKNLGHVPTTVPLTLPAYSVSVLTLR